MPKRTDLYRLSPAVLAAVGLSSACRLGPCLKMGPCLDVMPPDDTGHTGSPDDSGEHSVGPCLDVAPHSDSPGDSQESEVGPCLDMPPDSGCDSGDSGCDSGQQAHAEGAVARVLDAARTELTEAFDIAVEAVLERRILPEDVAARLRALREPDNLEKP